MGVATGEDILVHPVLFLKNHFKNRSIVLLPPRELFRRKKTQFRTCALYICRMKFRVYSSFLLLMLLKLLCIVNMYIFRGSGQSASVAQGKKSYRFRQ